MKSGQVEEYRRLSQFRDIEDFNNNFEQWMIDLKCKFTKSELIGLKRLVRYSAKIAGVCYAKIQTIVSSTHDKNQMGGISRSTFERMLRKAKNLGLVSVINTTNKRNRQAHNVYIFRKYQPVQEEVVKPSNTNDVANVENIDVPIKTSNLPQTTSIKNHNKRTNDVTDIKLSAEFVSNRVPKQFTDYVSCFYNDAQKIEEFWKVVKYQTRFHTYYSEQDRAHLALDSFKQLVRNIKLGNRKIRNVFGYFNGIVDKLLTKEYEQSLNEMFEEYA